MNTWYNTYAASEQKTHYASLNDSRFINPSFVGVTVLTGSNAANVMYGIPCLTATNWNGGIPCFLQYGANGSNYDYKIIDPIANTVYNASYTKNGVSTWSTSRVTY